jgi:hypothetical protein
MSIIRLILPTVRYYFNVNGVLQTFLCRMFETVNITDYKPRDNLLDSFPSFRGFELNVSLKVPWKTSFQTKRHTYAIVTAEASVWLSKLRWLRIILSDTHRMK